MTLCELAAKYFLSVLEALKKIPEQSTLVNNAIKNGNATIFIARIFFVTTCYLTLSMRGGISIVIKTSCYKLALEIPVNQLFPHQTPYNETAGNPFSLCETFPDKLVSGF